MAKQPRVAEPNLAPTKSAGPQPRSFQRCEILRITKGASLRGVSDADFERLVQGVKRDLEALRSGPRKTAPANRQAASGLSTMAEVQCWEVHRYYVTVNGIVYVCIQYECDDGRTFEECKPA